MDTARPAGNRLITPRAAVLACLFLLATYGTVPWGALWLRHALGIAPWPPMPWRLLGVPLLLAGLTAGASCAGLFLFSGRGTPVPYDPPAKLVITGLYAYCRNPMVASQLIALMGLGIAIGAWTMAPVVGVLAFVAHLYHRRVEERHLEARFGPQYEHYRSHVPMWLPRLKPYRPPT